jgi:hypothetical protein
MKAQHAIELLGLDPHTMPMPPLGYEFGGALVAPYSFYIEDETARIVLVRSECMNEVNGFMDVFLDRVETEQPHGGKPLKLREWVMGSANAGSVHPKGGPPHE